MSRKTPLLLDANIISHALAKNQTEAYAKLFRKYESSYTFWVTGYTRYELLKSSDKDYQAATREYIDQNLTLIELSQAVMDFSARVHNLYKTHSSTKGSKIADGDIVNAAVSIIKDIPVMTIDNNDYPRSFFIDDKRERVTYESSRKREITDTIYVLKPDMENIEYCFLNNNL